MKNFFWGGGGGGSLKNSTFRGGVSRKTNIEGGLPKTGGGTWTVYQFKRGEGLGKKRKVVFLRGG